MVAAMHAADCRDDLLQPCEGWIRKVRKLFVKAQTLWVGAPPKNKNKSKPETTHGTETYPIGKNSPSSQQTGLLEPSATERGERCVSPAEAQSRQQGPESQQRPSRGWM
eukprot:498562-Rhodomonas_salina.1